jgi:hypothetical protein
VQFSTRTRALQLGLAGAVAAALCVVLATRVFVSFDGLRAKLVRAPVQAQDGLVEIETAFDPRVASLNSPVALIASIANAGDAPQRIAISADDEAVCEVVIPAREVKRIDCVAARGWIRRPDHTVKFRAAAGAWSLDYFELASHHGSSTRALHFIVLPDVSSAYVRAGPLLVAMAWVLIAALSLVPVSLRWPRAAVHLVRGVRVTALLLLVVLLVSPWWSSFLVLTSLSSFAKITAALFAPQVAQLAVWQWAAVERGLNRYDRWRPVVTAAAVAMVVLVAYGLVIRETASLLEGRYSGLLRVSESFFDRVPFLKNRPEVRSSLRLNPDSGYDAQFQYFAIYDPLLRRYSAQPQMYREVADAPPYRFGRMGFPMLARLFAGSRWQWYPVTMVALVWLGVGLAAFTLALLAQRLGASAAWGLLVLLIPGFWQSVQVTLPEPVAAALLLLGYLSVLSKRFVLATCLFGVSLLVRETGIVFVLAIVLLTGSAELPTRARVMLLCSAVPIAVWRLYVAAVLWPDWGWQGLIYSPHVMTVPFAGLAGLWSDLANGQHHPGVTNLIRGAFWFSILLVGVCLAALPVARASGRVIGAALALYAIMALSFTHLTVWSHVSNGQRASFEVFLLLALATLSYRRQSTAIKATLATCWAASALYLLLGAHDVLLTRSALFPWT